MRRLVRRCSVLVLVLLVFLVPTALRAAPAQRIYPDPARHAESSFLDLVRSVLSVLWGENGSILDPSGASMAGDNGSGLDPDGRH